MNSFPVQRKVLDKGFVTLRNLAGPTARFHDDIQQFDACDVDVPQAARKSFNNMDKEYTYQQEMRLADYLWRNAHTTPFEMIESWWDVKLPIFVDRQWVRHRTWARDEVSARYVELPSDWYVPEVRDVGMKADDKKQGSRPIDTDREREYAEDFTQSLNGACRNSYELYKHYMSVGVAPEHARMFLHLNHYTMWTGKVDLLNLLKFLRLRVHAHAQWEIRQYAWVMIDELRHHIPGLMDIFTRYGTELGK